MEKKVRPEELLIAIHKHCLACSGGSRNEVHRCEIKTCNLWPWREPEAQMQPRKDRRQLTMFELLKEA